jgi:DNA-binding transcriptional ArsR family regulator
MSARAAATPIAEAAPVFAALGDATRLRIVARLCEGGPLSIARLAEGAAVSRQAITKHLRALEEAGLARSARVGRERIWELRPGRLAEARRCLDRISLQWDAALDRLRAFVEGGGRGADDRASRPPTR